MSWVAVAAAAAVASTAITGYSAYTSNKTAEKQAEADANAQLARGRLEAERIRKEKDKAQSRARAAAAGNGLDVHEGTALVINDQIELDANYDANMAEITGYNNSQRLQGEASVYGRNAMMAGITTPINMVATGANGVVDVRKAKATAQQQAAITSAASSNTTGGWK
ncbi:hypothetical protein [Acinetobacter lwoffii]|uniref:hypothetical protein n=1 Tax=Acinetobacter lwoffii TaxID=28090 RepID=UPI00110CB03D|nr:hypothetical protein [Acinetobacter lwoffii]NGP41067.1 hypothetical protein [Acinetobacter lwoffii]TMS43490.1 hypothetical protein FGQ54_14595 [Acinetobacter lwoffii]